MGTLVTKFRLPSLYNGMSSISAYRAILFFVIVMVLACSKEESIVDAGLQSYFDAFEHEASIRNLRVSFSDNPVEGRLELHENDLRLGWCEIQPGRTDKVIINLWFWDIFDELDKEKLVFHELGHCMLSRSHRDELKDNGRCRSIMQSGQHCSDDYSLETREAYLDELFLRK